MTINTGFSHWKWWFSITMLNYQRVNKKHVGSFSTKRLWKQQKLRSSQELLELVVLRHRFSKKAWIQLEEYGDGDKETWGFKIGEAAEATPSKSVVASPMNLLDILFMMVENIVASRLNFRVNQSPIKLVPSFHGFFLRSSMPRSLRMSGTSTLPGAFLKIWGTHGVHERSFTRCIHDVFTYITDIYWNITYNHDVYIYISLITYHSHLFSRLWCMVFTYNYHLWITHGIPQVVWSVTSWRTMTKKLKSEVDCSSKKRRRQGTVATHFFSCR